MKTWYDLHTFNTEDGSWSKQSLWSMAEARKAVHEIKEANVNQWYLTEVKIIDGRL